MVLVVDIAWAFWFGCMGVVVLIFWALWRYADRIERLEEEEQQWLQYIEQLWYVDPYQAQYYQQLFENRFIRR